MNVVLTSLHHVFERKTNTHVEVDDKNFPASFTALPRAVLREDYKEYKTNK